MPVCILGMHRSNTSMVAQLLSKCGVFVGPESELFAATADNKEGYWEDRRFVALNTALIKALGGTWDKPPALSPGWASAPELSSLRKEAAELAATNCEHRYWGWKDPRTCITAEFWREVVPDLKFVVCLRHPIEVAQSLANRSLTSLPYDEGIRLWGDYHALLTPSLTDENSIVTYSGCYFFDPASELQRVLDFIGVEASKKEVKAATAAVKADLRQSTRLDFAELEQAMPTDVRTLYASLVARAGPVYERLSADPVAANAGQIDTLEKALARIRALEGFVSAKADESRASAARLTELEDLVNTMSKQLVGQQAQIKEAWGKYQERERELIDQSKTIYEQNDEIGRLALEVKAQYAEVHKRDLEIQGLREAAYVQHQELVALRALADELKFVKGTFWWRCRELAASPVRAVRKLLRRG